MALGCVEKEWGEGIGGIEEKGREHRICGFEGDGFFYDFDDWSNLDRNCESNPLMSYRLRQTLRETLC